MKKTLMCVLLAAGCSASTKPEASDSFDDLATLDQKSDAFSSRMKIVGTIASGHKSPTVHYSKSPRYRALVINAKGPAVLDFWVRSSDGGDAVAWLLDGSYHVLAHNDDADASTYDAHVSYTLPSWGATYLIVLRDYDYARHSFVVDVGSLGAAASDDPRSYGFQQYWKCPDDNDVQYLGDKVTPGACLDACQAVSGSVGCWYLDGSGGFPRDCRVCKTLEPVKETWANDWAMSLEGS